MNAEQRTRVCDELSMAATRLTLINDTNAGNDLMFSFYLDRYEVTIPFIEGFPPFLYFLPVFFLATAKNDGVHV